MAEKPTARKPYTPTKAATEIPADFPVMAKIKQAAPILNCSAKHLNDLLNEGAIKGVKIGNTWRIPRSVILEMIGG